MEEYEGLLLPFIFLSIPVKFTGFFVYASCNKSNNFISIFVIYGKRRLPVSAYIVKGKGFKKRGGQFLPFLRKGGDLKTLPRHIPIWLKERGELNVFLNYFN